MKRPSRNSVRSLLRFSALGLALAITQSGCPGGADLENPGAWASRVGAENGAVAGTGGTSPSGPVLDFSTVPCTGTSATTLLGKCTSCHGKTLRLAELDLRPDAGFAQRTLDVAATFGAIACEGDPLSECIPDTCPNSATLVSSLNPASSWLLLKSLGTQGACGESMPQGKPALSGDEAACMTAIVEAVAALK